MTDLKLGKLPDRAPVKLTITIAPSLNHALQAYAELYRELVSAPVSPAALKAETLTLT